MLRLSFERLCDNRHPFTGYQLTARMRKDRRVGYDFTFDAPKSVSILYGITDDTAILDAFRQAVRATMEEMEEGVKTRVRKRGQYGERIVGNMAWAEFIHFTARPVKGEIDPHLHAHCFVPNVCWDRVEHAWKAIDVASVKESAPHWQAAFQRRFGQRLAELGYGVAWSGDHFEITGIGRATIDRFSRRTNQINQTAEKRGITDPRDKSRLGAMTRERKRKDATMPQLRARWRERLNDDERAALALAGWKRRWHAGTPYPQAQARPERDAWEKERIDFIRLRQPGWTFTGNRRAMSPRRNGPAMDDSGLLSPALAGLEARPKQPRRKPDFTDDNDGPDEIVATGDAFATVKGQRHADGLRFIRPGRQCFTLSYNYLPIPWWDAPGLLLLEYPGLFTLRLTGKEPEALEPPISERRITWIRECDPDEAADLPIAVFRIDILHAYPSRDAAGFDAGGE